MAAEGAAGKSVQVGFLERWWVCRLEPVVQREAGLQWAAGRAPWFLLAHLCAGFREKGGLACRDRALEWLLSLGGRNLY